MVDHIEGELQLPKGKSVIPSIYPMLAGAGTALDSIGSSIGQLSRALFIGGGGLWKGAAADGGATLAVTAFAGLSLAAAVFYTTR
ncbi:hypothetical protein CASFOL_003365 [Castilleja foliolosa]|uniref:H(+)-exporting diphosphatase n=1 Tax=Castilleja foliolosa TaxID=1961234 RepID=A0ABD3EHE9_9LAMI